MSAPLPSGPVTVGVDVGGTKVLAGVVDAGGSVLEIVRRETPGRTNAPRVVEDVIVDAVGELIRRRRAVVAVGVAAAGYVDARRGLVRFAPHIHWRDEPLRDRLAERLRLPVVVENDATAALRGETAHGAARGVRDVVLVALGTGLGGALLAGGCLQRGANGMTGEFGHLRLVPGGRPCACGLTGCWEEYCSGTALARAAHARGLRLSGASITAAAVNGEPAAVAAYADVGRWLGHGVAALTSALDPELVLVAGGLSVAEDLLLEPARAVLEREVTGVGYRDLPWLLPAALGPAAGMVGAARLAADALG